MKLLRLLLLFILVSGVGVSASAQSTCQETGTASGTDASGTNVSISSFPCTSGGAITAMTLTTTNTSNYCNNWYSYNISVTHSGGTEQTTGNCNVTAEDLATFNGATIDVSTITNVTVTSVDDDNYGDNVTVDVQLDITYTPPACPAPSGLTASSITATSATVEWIAAAGATAYNWEVVETGTGQGGTVVSSGSGAGVTGSATGLTGNMTYDLWVQTDCGGSGTSIYSGPYSFITLPSAHSFPLTEDFEAGFTYFDNASGNDLDFAISTSYYHGGTQSIHNAHGSSEENILHETGILDLSGTSAALLEFWHIAKTEGGYDKCYVEISTDGGATYTAIPNSAYQGSAGDYSSKVYFHEDSYGTWGTSATTPDNATWWQKETFSLAGYNVANVRFRFRLTSDGSAERAGWYIDDIIVHEPSCFSPINLGTSALTATTATATWDVEATATSGYNWEVVPSGDGQGVNVVVSGNVGVGVTSASVTGLTANTSYDLYVQSDCGGNGTAWSIAYTFTTLCAAVTDFSENFDGVTTPALPGCFQKSGTSGTLYTQTSNNNSSPNCLYIYSSSTSNKATVVLPEVTNIDAGTHRLRFQARGNFSSGAVLNIGYITDPNDAATFTSVTSVTIASTSYAEYVATLGVTPPSGSYLAIQHSGSPANSTLIDDMVWEAIPVGPPSCSQISTPADASTDIAVTTNLSWASNIDATGYKLSIGTTMGGTDILNASDLGNVTSYDPPTDLVFGQTYYVTLIAYNANGDATSCTETSFTTTDGCITATTPADASTDIGVLSSASWSAVTGATGYKVSIGTSAGGTDVVNASDNGNSTTYDMSGASLAYSTTYHITIVAYNANGDATGCSSTSFTTQADPTVTAPWTDDVESHTTTTSSSISTNGWGSNPSGTSSAFRWDVDGAGSTPSGSTGPSGANSGTKYFYTEATSGSQGDVAELTTPPADVSGLTTPFLYFYYHMYGVDMGDLHVDVYNGTTWTNSVYTLSGQQQTAQGDAWQEAAVDLSSYGSTVTVRFRGIRGADYTSDISLDDIRFDEAPATPPNCDAAMTSPTDAATGVGAGATISWSAATGAATGYKIQIGTTMGGSEFLAQTDVGNVLTYDPASDFAFNTTYYVNITPYNANGDANSGCTETSFTTGANPNYGGGPDGTDPNQMASGGYYFANSLAAGNGLMTQPTYSWIDPVAAGHTQIIFGSVDDNNSQEAIGFNFDFYGTTYTDVYVGTNGYLSLGNSYSAQPGSHSIPANSDGSATRAMIHVAGADLDGDNPDAKIYAGGDANHFVVTWYKYEDFGDQSEYITCQVILYSDGKIVMQYNDIESTADENTDLLNDFLIGIENPDGTKGIEYRNNGSGGPMFGSPMALAFNTTESNLPVELTAFTAQAEGTTNVLNWTTSSEENNAGFDVERSANGIDFETIGQVEGNGTTVEVSNYNFVDETPTTVSYYRLRQVDFDGNYEHSNVVVVKREAGNNNVMMFPIPVQDRLTVQYTAATDEEMTITVVDATGRTVVTKAVTATQGENQFKLDLNELPSGSYFVRLQSENSNIIRTIVKQ